MSLTLEQIASIVHEANRRLRLVLGQAPGPHWQEMDERNQSATMNGVTRALEGASPEELHTEWLSFRSAQGWVWGAIKDTTRKKHPCMLPWAELPEHERMKTDLFHAMVGVLRKEMADEAQ